MALNLQRFLRSMKLFFSTINKEFKPKLFEELWGCQTFIGLDMDYIKSMPVWERKYQIARHNDKMKKDNEERTSALNKAKNKK